MCAGLGAGDAVAVVPRPSAGRVQRGAEKNAREEGYIHDQWRADLRGGRCRDVACAHERCTLHAPGELYMKPPFHTREGALAGDVGEERRIADRQHHPRPHGGRDEPEAANKILHEKSNHRHVYDDDFWRRRPLQRPHDALPEGRAFGGIEQLVFHHELKVAAAHPTLVVRRRHDQHVGATRQRRLHCGKRATAREHAPGRLAQPTRNQDALERALVIAEWFFAVDVHTRGPYMSPMPIPSSSRLAVELRVELRTSGAQSEPSSATANVGLGALAASAVNTTQHPHPNIVRLSKRARKLRGFGGRARPVAKAESRLALPVAQLAQAHERGEVADERTAAAAGKLTVHKRTHSGERPFACDEPGCEYSAAQAGSLKAHKRTHSGAEKGNQ
ncbi:hypothetical protein T492DRAFT_1132653 [Pavlovales sp. CCMP2436]|nr:hypothetical protein T492DRAFT_1132653 [Pavlovales sp. CCMP2436]